MKCSRKNPTRSLKKKTMIDFGDDERNDRGD